jgi:hypothetical protein
MTPGVNPVIRLSESTKWPGVKDGTYNEKDAHKFFAAYFTQPSTIKIPAWINEFESFRTD